jgi:DNA-binding LacI/PurR family transcriptional regulator/signal transduction histidine kinase
VNKKTQERRKIAFLCNSIEYPYYIDILSGIRKALSNTRYDLSVYVGGNLGILDQIETGQNIVYQLVHEKSIDGMIILGDLGREISPKVFKNFCNQYKNIEKISIAFPVKDAIQIEVDYEQGIREMVEHIIVTHGYRRIACISGPENNIESQLKLNAFKAAMEEHGISIDPELVYFGDLNYHSGRDAVEELIEKKKLNIDCIFALSDGMAVAAHDMLVQKGYSIPEDIALVCFNDSADLLNYTPSMTTINQNLVLQGKAAGQAMIDRFEGKKQAHIPKIPSSLIVRESCGCAPEIKLLSPILDEDNHKLTFKDFVLKLHASLEKSQGAYGLSNIPQEYHEAAKELISALSDEVEGGFTKNKFNKEIMRITALPGIGDIAMEFWNSFLLMLHQELHLHMDRNDPGFQIFENRIHDALRLFARYLIKSHRVLDYDFKTFLFRIRYFSQFINSSTQISSLKNNISRWLPEFSIHKFAVVLYASGIHTYRQSRPIPKTSKIILAHDEDGEIALSAEDSLIDSADFQPHSFKGSFEGTTFIVLPLYFRKTHYGYIALEYKPEVRPVVYSTLPELISSALNIVYTLNNLKSLEQQIRQTSHLATLGEITSSIAHELRNPINVIMNSSTLDLESIKDVKEQLRNLEAEKESLADLEKQLSFIEDSSQGILNQGREAFSIISGILKQARGETGSIEDCNINNLLQETITLVLHSQKSKYPDLSLSIETDLRGTLPNFRGNISQLNRAFLNIIVNAVDAIRYRAQETKQYQGKLLIRSKVNNGRILIQIRDNGIGMEEATREKIFEPFFSTKPTDEGTGLGLKIAYEIIVDIHSGDLFCDSQVGEYTEFTIIL